MGGGDGVTGFSTPRQANRTIHINTVEGAFSILKRGMKGVYQHLANSICIAISQSSSSAITNALLLALMTVAAFALQLLV